MKQIDNFLDKKDFEDLKTVLLDPTFPWALNHGVSYPYDGHIQFTHTIYNDNVFQSTWTLGGLDIFKEKLNIQSLVRAKVNLLPKNEKIIEHEAHIDIPDPKDGLMTAILYMNTNNGYTKFESGEKVDSVENRLVIFDAKTKHSGSTNSCDAPYRLVFNLNYF
tara:strand:- start:301 stop:789 length:489 start_codon:yes stop_codon:yes gene_type:complete